MALALPRTAPYVFSATRLRPFGCLAIPAPAAAAGTARTFTTSRPRAHASPTEPRRTSHSLQPPPLLAGAVAPDTWASGGSTSPGPSAPTTPAAATAAAHAVASDAPLAHLPLASLLRSLLTATVSSQPALLDPALRLLAAIAHARHPLLAPARNPLVRWILRPTLYAQFCAGETPAEVRATVARLRGWGIQGVLLGWARECVDTAAATPAAAASATHAQSKASSAAPAAAATDDEAIGAWLAGSQQTLALLRRDDILTLKLTGAGPAARAALRAADPPPSALAAGLDALCAAAAERGVAVALDAEQLAMQPGIEAWTLALQRRCNRYAAVVLGTYQAYLCATPARLAADLAAAAAGRFTLGVKLVRGAYLGTDPRAAICPTKEATDAAYDDLAAALIAGTWTNQLPPPPGEAPPFPPCRLVLATHNAASAQRAMALQRDCARPGCPPVTHAQLMGMAEHVTCGLVCAAGGTAAGDRTAPRPYKYLVWGSLEDCLQYLVRRAEENRDAVGRTREERGLLMAELRQRVAAALGMGGRI